MKKKCYYWITSPSMHGFVVSCNSETHGAYAIKLVEDAFSIQFDRYHVSSLILDIDNVLTRKRFRMRHSICIKLLLF